jgi:hypothetical protein
MPPTALESVGIGILHDSLEVLSGVGIEDFVSLGQDARRPWDLLFDVAHAFMKQRTSGFIFFAVLGDGEEFIVSGVRGEIDDVIGDVGFGRVHF